MKKRKKEIIKIFKSFGLSINVTTNVTSGNFLDVDIILTTDIYKLYRKPNDKSIYTNRNSYNSPNIAQQILLSVSSRTANNSSNQFIFNKCIPMYRKALKKSVFNDDIICSLLIERKNQREKSPRKEK